MNALGEAIRALIHDDGPISVERYMQLCLQHPVHGYYRQRTAIGRSGDFITAPEVSQMFGELIGLWAAQVWLDGGAPPLIHLVELGPGRGTMMADALRATRRVPGFHAALRVSLVETSSRLRELQQGVLAAAPCSLVWHERFDDVAPGPAIVLANEFFDALPVRQYVRHASGWHERMIGLDQKGSLVFGIAPDPIEIGPGLDRGVPGQLLEIGHAAIAATTALARRLCEQGGALLACDYGHGASGLGETLQAVREHRYASVLDSPGEVDLTVHVDFAALGRVAHAAGATAYRAIPQGTFLERLGLHERAASLRRAADAVQDEAISAAVERLTAPSSSMATLFKAFALTQPGARCPPGFEEAA